MREGSYNVQAKPRSKCWSGISMMRHEKEHLWEIIKKKKKKTEKLADQNFREKLGPDLIKKKLSPATNALACKSLLVLTEKASWTLKTSLLMAGRALISQQGPWGVELCVAAKLNISATFSVSLKCGRMLSQEQSFLTVSPLPALSEAGNCSGLWELKNYLPVFDHRVQFSHLILDCISNSSPSNEASCGQHASWG